MSPSSSASQAAAVRAVAVPLGAAFVGSTLVSPLYAVYQREFGFSELTLTLIFAGYVLGNLVALVWFGRLSDQAGRRRVAVPAIAIAILSAVLFLLVRSTAWLYAARAVSGLANGLISGAATAWIAELTPGTDRARATVTISLSNYVGLGLGPVAGGLLAQYGPSPTRLCFALYLAALIVAIVWIVRAPETVEHRVRSWRELSLRPRIGVPGDLWHEFVTPAVTGFATFALVGFYAALAPNFLTRTLHVESAAAGGGLIGELFLAGAIAVLLWRRGSRHAIMIGSLWLLLLSLGILVLANELRSLAILIAGTAVAGAAAGLGFRGSLEVVNKIAPEAKRAEVISSYLVATFLGNALPVIGVGVLTEAFNSQAAELALTVTVALLAVVALVFGRKPHSVQAEPPHGVPA